MATRNLDVTTSPQSVATALGLNLGEADIVNVVIQNVSNTATLFVREQVMPPSAGHRGVRVESSGTYRAKLWAQLPAVWIWTDDRAGCQCVARILYP